MPMSSATIDEKKILQGKRLPERFRGLTGSKDLSKVLIQGNFPVEFFNQLKDCPIKDIFVLEGRPSLKAVKDSTRELNKLGFTPTVMADNMAGYLFYKKLINEVWIACQAVDQEKIVCDAAVFMKALTERLQQRVIKPQTDWIAQCNAYQDQFPWVGPEHADQGDFMNSYRFMERLNSFFKKDQVVVTDMGTALLSGHQVLRIANGQRLMTSTGLGEMGYGLPAAIGASFALNRGEVMCLNCDGGMMLNLQELQTVMHHKLPIKLFIFINDGYFVTRKHNNHRITHRRWK